MDKPRFSVGEPVYINEGYGYTIEGIIIHINVDKCSADKCNMYTYNVQKIKMPTGIVYRMPETSIVERYISKE